MNPVEREGVTAEINVSAQKHNLHQNDGRQNGVTETAFFFFAPFSGFADTCAGNSCIFGVCFSGIVFRVVQNVVEIVHKSLIPP